MDIYDPLYREKLFAACNEYWNPEQRSFMEDNAQYIIRNDTYVEEIAAWFMVHEVKDRSNLRPILIAVTLGAAILVFLTLYFFATGVWALGQLNELSAGYIIILVFMLLVYLMEKFRVERVYVTSEEFLGKAIKLHDKTMEAHLQGESRAAGSH